MKQIDYNLYKGRYVVEYTGREDKRKSLTVSGQWIRGGFK